MKVLTKFLGLLVFVFSLAYYQAAPVQWGHGRGHGPKKHHYHRPHRPHYKKVKYRRPPGNYYKRHYYRPVRHYYYSRPHRVYYNRPVVVVRHR
ncbi:hypothetical protein [uncultured Chryseobacterium sp.]|uniref:hypothetical protein n=1 Tax=uncultured Chryseobacterium sp. TaxID=259322 RepID=UPI0025F8C550|nr:hypothetical protein [uncultured Chryseobacterium sp.]